MWRHNHIHYLLSRDKVGPFKLKPKLENIGHISGWKIYQDKHVKNAFQSIHIFMNKKFFIKNVK